VAVLGRSRSRREVSRPIRPEPMVGKQGVVREQIANRYGVGCIELEGEIWTARSFDRDRVIDPGVEVTVVEVRGGTALVSD
jgi:membrane protein implicated in regulation of membrane protease activity